MYPGRSTYPAYTVTICMYGWYTYYGLGEWLVCVAVAYDGHSGFGGFREPENYIRGSIIGTPI